MTGKLRLAHLPVWPAKKSMSSANFLQNSSTNAHVLAGLINRQMEEAGHLSIGGLSFHQDMCLSSEPQITRKGTSSRDNESCKWPLTTLCHSDSHMMLCHSLRSLADITAAHSSRSPHYIEGLPMWVLFIDASEGKYGRICILLTRSHA